VARSSAGGVLVAIGSVDVAIIGVVAGIVDVAIPSTTPPPTTCTGFENDCNTEIQLLPDAATTA
jgi:hypothetical protein